MLYKEFGKTKEKVSALGFGCMRFQVLDGDQSKIDEEKAIEQIRYAIDEGVNYVDTAWPYHGEMSEIVVGKALKDGYREKVHLATKLPSWLINSREDMDKYLNKQLEKLQTDHIDFYLIHALNQKFWDNLLTHDLFEFCDQVKKDGRVKHIGFSFHDELPVYKEIIDAYDWDFTQIQYNLLDEFYQAGKEGLDYASSKGMGIVIMEPLRGGKLVGHVPSDVQALYDSYDPNRSSAEWALKFLWNNPQVHVVLSGMTLDEHIVENIKVASSTEVNSLSDEEVSIINQVRDIYQSRILVNCTGCNYCMPCPHGVNIPKNFTYYNNASIYEDVETYKEKFLQDVKDDERASMCIACGECEPQCPQFIPIIENLQDVSRTFEQ